MKKTKRLVAILIALIMVLAFIPFKVFAGEFGEGSITLQVDISINDSNFSVSNVKVNGNNWTDHNDVFKTTNGQYSISGTINSENGDRPRFMWGGDLNDYMDEYAEIEIRPESETVYSFDITLSEIGTAVDDHESLIGFIGFGIEAEQPAPPPDEGGGNPPAGDNHNTQDYNGNATATLNYSVNGVVEYDAGPFEGLGINFSINDVRYKPDGGKMNYTEGVAYERDGNGQLILDDNENPIPILDPETMQPMTEKTSVTVTGDTIHYDSDSDKVRFVFMMNPGTLMTGLRINGQTINNLPSTREELAAAYTDHRLEIVVDNIDKAETYNIEITGRYPNSNEEFQGNFLWDYNPKGYTGPEDKILNATLTFVEAEYDGKKYTTPEQVNELGGIYIWRDAERKKKYSDEDEREGCGEAQFPVGTKLTVKIIPDAGYQLVDFGINGGAFDSQEEIGTYTFEVKGGPFHLQATIAQVEDVVKSKSEKIKSGNIELGEKEESMSVGTARLDIDDVELTEKQISNFEEAAEGYDIKNYIDISLFNTVFKGKETASWDTEVKDLKNEASITLKLEDNVDGNEIVIVHEKHDGTYEIIPVEYDATTGTITFKTKSFSNYAIATKTSAKEKYTINTGDFTLTFSDEAGHSFEASIVELWNLTDEQLKELNMTAEEYAKGKKNVEEKVKNYGAVINLYDITVSDNNYSHSGEITIKVKMTDEMKKYNSFKLVCIDGDVIGKNDVVELKVEGDYLVGNLFHLSNYALVGENVETNSANPTTGDNIFVFIAIFGAAAFLGSVVLIKRNKEIKNNKH